MSQRLLAIVFSFLVASGVIADDWPQFRGPDRDGVSKEKGLLKKWPEKGPKLLWTYKDAGLGHSSFAVVKGVLYTLGTDYDFKDHKNSAKDEYVLAIDAKSGKEIWRVQYAPLYTTKGNSYGDGPRATPTIDGNMLYALGGLGELVCFDISAKPKEVWRKNFIKDFNGELMTNYGYSESPLIDGDLLICTPGGADGTLAALNKKTGVFVWRSKDFAEKAPYSSVVAANIHGVRQYLQIGYDGKKNIGYVAGIDAKAGKTLWKSQIFSVSSDGVSTSPIVKGNEVYVTAPWGGGCHLFEIDKKFAAKELYSKKDQKRFRNTFGGVVVVGGTIYGHSEPGVWLWQDWKTGGEEWLERNDLKCQSGAILAADGMLYLYTDEGEAALVGANPKAFNLISQFTIPKRSEFQPNRVTSQKSRVWAHPAIANGVLYLRDQEYIFAFEIK